MGKNKRKNKNTEPSVTRENKEEEQKAQEAFEQLKDEVAEIKDEAVDLEQEKKNKLLEELEASFVPQDTQATNDDLLSFAEPN